MRRRTLISSAAGLVAGGFAGCVSNGDGGDGGDDADTPDGSQTGTSGDRTPENDTATTESGDGGTAPPPATELSLTDASLTVVDAGCGQQRDEAEVAFERDAGEVVVTGTIWGSDLCKIPTLADARYDAKTDELVVIVGTANRDTDGTTACAQCISELDYEVTCSFDGGLPGSVTVRHGHGDDPGTVATATRS